jgi:hypothetical protein
MYLCTVRVHMYVTDWFDATLKMPLLEYSFTYTNVFYSVVYY